MMERPLYDNIVVMPDEVSKTTASGIILPKTDDTQAQVGTVKAVGAGYRLSDGTMSPLAVKVGDKVLYPSEAGNLVKLEETEFRVMRERELHGVLSDS